MQTLQPTPVGSWLMCAPEVSLGLLWAVNLLLDD